MNTLLEKEITRNFKKKQKSKQLYFLKGMQSITKISQFYKISKVKLILHILRKTEALKLKKTSPKRKKKKNAYFDQAMAEYLCQFLGRTMNKKERSFLHGGKISLS